jgi:hypothetical protein
MFASWFVARLAWVAEGYPTLAFQSSTITRARLQGKPCDTSSLVFTHLESQRQQSIGLRIALRYGDTSRKNRAGPVSGIATYKR